MNADVVVVIETGRVNDSEGVSIWPFLGDHLGLMTWVCSHRERMDVVSCRSTAVQVVRCLSVVHFRIDMVYTLDL